VNQQSVVVLGATENQIPVIEEAKKRGYNAIVVDNVRNNPGHEYSSKSYITSTTNIPAVLSIAKSHRVAAVIAHGSDPAALTASLVSQSLGLAGDNPGAVKIMQNKMGLRRLQKHLGLPHPEFYDINEPGDIKNILPLCPKGVLIKPVDCSGSTGITWLNQDSTIRQISSALKLAKLSSRSKQIIVEQGSVRTGTQLGGDVVYSNGQVLYVFFTTQFLAHSGSSLAVGANFLPTTFDNSFTEKSLDQLKLLIGASGLSQGVYNFEFLQGENGEPILIDFGARSGGGLYSQLSEFCWGVNTVALNLDLALGVNPKPPTKFNSPVPTLGITLNSQHPGRFHEVSKSEELSGLIQYEFIRLKPGDKVHRFEKAGDRLGMIIACQGSGDSNILLEIAKNLDSHVKVILR
jgi:biotin carboxylase